MSVASCIAKPGAGCEAAMTVDQPLTPVHSTTRVGAVHALLNDRWEVRTGFVTKAPALCARCGSQLPGGALITRGVGQVLICSSCRPVHFAAANLADCPLCAARQRWRSSAR